jgi:hypothetical protein
LYNLLRIHCTLCPKYSKTESSNMQIRCRLGAAHRNIKTNCF